MKSIKLFIALALALAALIFCTGGRGLAGLLIATSGRRTALSACRTPCIAVIPYIPSRIYTPTSKTAGTTCAVS